MRRRCPSGKSFDRSSCGACEKLEDGVTALARMSDGVRARVVSAGGKGGGRARRGQSRIEFDEHEPSFKKDRAGACSRGSVPRWMLSVVWREVVAVVMMLPTP